MTKAADLPRTQARYPVARPVPENIWNPGLHRSTVSLMKKRYFCCRASRAVELGQLGLPELPVHSWVIATALCPLQGSWTLLPSTVHPPRSFQVALAQRIAIPASCNLLDRRPREVRSTPPKTGLTCHLDLSDPTDLFTIRLVTSFSGRTWGMLLC